MCERKIRLVLSAATAGMLLFASTLMAQRITGQIKGSVTDPSSVPLSGVTVELTSNNIIGTRTTVTKDRGNYHFITLPPGLYNLTFRYPGFKIEERWHVPVAVGTATRKDVKLSLAIMADTVDVTAEMSRVNGLKPSGERLDRFSASKRAQSLEEAPISIAFDALAIENRTMYELSDLADFTPNLECASISSVGGTNATVFIRGLGQIENNLWSEPGVGIFLDGVYLSRLQGAVLNLIDVEVVEVLRGPQGTLFGKNTLGGALSIITRKPGSDLVGHLEVTAGSFDRLNISARMSGGLSPNFSGSLSVASANARGFTRSLTTGEDYSDDNDDSARLAWHWQATQSVVFDWSVDTSRQRERGVDLLLANPPVEQGLTPLVYTTAIALAGQQPYDERWFTGNLRESYSTFPGFTDSDILGASLDIHGLLGTNLSARSITSYRQMGLSESRDLDGSPNRIFDMSTESDQRQWSEEIWLSGLIGIGDLRWSLGGFYLEEQRRQTFLGRYFGDLFKILEDLPGPVISPLGDICDPPDPTCYGGVGNPRNLHWPTVFNIFQDDKLSARTYAFFGESTLDLSDRLSLTAGFRYSYEKKKWFNISRPVNDEKSWGSVTARLSLAFQATPRMALYFSTANGFKSGGFKFSARGEAWSIDPERVWSYEAGFRADLFLGRLRLQTALFWNDYTDLQLSAHVSDPKATGKAEIAGFDVSLQALPSERFHVEVGLGHVDAKYVELETRNLFGVTPNIDGALPRAPEWNLVISPEFAFPLPREGSIVLHADYTYKTQLFYDPANLVAQEAYALINARTSFILPSGAWEAYAYGTNLGDEEYIEHGYYEGSIGTPLLVAGRPREWGVGLKYRF